MIEPDRRAARDTDVFVVLGFIFAALGFTCCCCGPLFAIPSIVLGAIAYSRGDRRGLWVIIAGAVALLAGGGFGVFGYRSVPYHHWGPDRWQGPWQNV